MLKAIKHTIESATQAILSAARTWKDAHDAQVYAEGASYAFYLLWTGKKTLDQIQDSLKASIEDGEWSRYEDGVSDVVDWWLKNGITKDTEWSD